MRPPLSDKPINVNVIARKIDVDNRLPLRNYYRIADNLLKQASIYREENNVIDLYVILLRYSSLVSETIPFHRDYQVLFPKERAFYKKKLLPVLDELESLQPKFRRLLHDLNKAYARTQESQLDGRGTYGLEESQLEWPSGNGRDSLSLKRKQPSRKAPSTSWRPNNDSSQVLPSSMETQFQKLSFNLPLPKQETLSRHSLLGPNGLRGQWQGPTPQIKVYYPSNADMPPIENSGLDEAEQSDLGSVNDGKTGMDNSVMESLLSLDDGRWSHPADESCASLNNEASNGPLTLGNIRQPSPPPVLAQVQPGYMPISPSRVADPRPGPAKPFHEDMPDSNSYQDLHIPVKMMEDFLRLAQGNTKKNLETCGVLAGSLKNRVFHITTLIIPKQESTSDSCQTLNEEEIFDVQDKLSLFPLGWIHTHPSQTCFMSSVDLHTHYSYQIMLPEAIAIVMAPTDTSSPHGIFHLSDPSGISVIRNCQQRGFHPHEEPEDGSSIYEHCSHVYMNSNLKFDVVDLR
ncbi:Proteasome endopeptidase complex [Bertholletia excelsa]